jgi:NADPH-dependent 2,4-dienoyl-CoA reductase/sulfur reductase-like enzyme/ferredoxin
VDRLTTFPNYTQIPSRIPVKVWQGMRAGSLVAGVAVAALLIVAPDTGLFVMWKVIIPTLPALFMIAPGLWRNLCPLAASNQTPRALKITRALTAPNWLKEYGYVIAFTLFGTFVLLRRFGLDDSGPLSALLLLGAMIGAFAGGMVLKGKSGWCSTICPLLPVQRIYGQTPLALIANAHCQPCVGCVKNCYDFNPRAAYLADLHDDDSYWSGYRRFFVGAFPGLVLGFFAIPDGRWHAVLGGIALCVAVSIASFAVLSTFVKTSPHTLTSLYGAVAFGIFYWYASTILPEALTWAVRAAAIALAATWFIRTVRKEAAFLERAGDRPVPATASPAAAAIAGARASSGNGKGPEVTFVPQNKHVVPKPGQSLLEIAEANGLRIEAGCRMGICGADPVAIKEGMECTSAVSDDERSTLERLGLASNTRMACCVRVNGPVKVDLTPDRAEAPSISKIANFKYDRSIERVVVVGNGIAGVTAADHLRRRHPETAIDLVAEEPHHLYNRMGISRLVYGRSAMQGLYLNPEAWYDDRGITTWLNTRALWIDRSKREIALGTGDKLRYDRVILATGSRSFVPRISGFGAGGTGVLRTAADAMDLRAFAQRVGSQRAIVAGGGLLGLEAAYALLKLGLRTVVLERSASLLRRQLDARAGDMLRHYLEGLGIEILLNAEVGHVEAGSRLRAVHLQDGRRLEAQIMLVAAGIQPNVDLAADAKLEVNRGLLVDDHMRSSDPAILAAGDVAEFDGQVPGLWPTAVAQAEVAAENAVGGDKAYIPVIPATILKVVGIELTSIGRIEAAPGEEAIVLEDAAGGHYRKLIISEGRIAGAILLGHGNDAAAVRTAITRGFDVSAHLDELRAGRWEVLAQLSGDQPLVPAAAA